MTRLEELANMSVDSGSFLKFDNGYAFIIQVVDTDNIQEVEKAPFKDGGKVQTKYQWRVILKEVKIMDATVVDYKRHMNPEKSAKIEGQPVNKVYTLELPKNATKKLSKYILDQGITKTMLLKFWRTGDKFDTKYTFMTEIQK